MPTSKPSPAPRDPNVIGPGDDAASPRLIFDIRHWLEAFAIAVRQADYARGRQLFAPDVYAFGTAVHIAEGIDELVKQQWEATWSSTRGYHFDLEQLSCGGEGDCAWAAVPWKSQGQRPDGSWFDRRGRATFVLQHTADGWRAIHSHHSLEPR